MRKYTFMFSIVILCSILLNGCAGDVPEKECEETMCTTETTIVPEPRTEELIIQSGEKEIYGKIFYPGTSEQCPAVILSHGYNGCHTDFLSECQYFADNGFIAYTFDFCGGSTRSKSSGKTTDMTIFTEKEDLLAVIDFISAMEQVDPDRVFLLGGSQGGLVTAMAAEERTEQVRGVVLYFPAFNIPDDWRKNYQSVDQIPESVDFWGLELGRNFFVSMRDYVTYDNIGAFSNEVLILHGDQDAIVPLAASQKAVQKYENAKIVVMPGEGHGFSPAGAKTAMERALEFMKEQ